MPLYRPEAQTPCSALCYVMDPMCSWCRAFAPVLDELTPQIRDDLPLIWVMGGLAPETEEPMPEAMRAGIAAIWRQIETLTGLPFNHSFWQTQTPRRSTYPACKAVIAADLLQPGAFLPMVRAIQRAYYEEARNPSLYETLTELAAEIGLDREKFAAEIHGQAVASLLDAHFGLRDRLGVAGYPALVWLRDGEVIPVSHGYCRAEMLRKRLEELALLR